MGQALAFVILLALAFWVWDKVKGGKEPSVVKPKKSGDVIDISEAWIPMDNLPYRRRESLLEENEAQLFSLLHRWAEERGYLVFPRVWLPGVMGVPANTENRLAYQARIKEKCADFLICSRDVLTPLAIVITEGTQDPRKKQINDAFVRRAAEAAGIPCVNLNISNIASEDELSHKLRRLGL